MSPIYIFTENYFLKARIKYFIKKLLGRNLGGPEAVLKSLITGLRENGVNFQINIFPKEGCGVACVISGVKTLQWAIKQKQLGKIQKIIAGPNIVVTPFDCENLILAPEINTYLVPAQWSKEWWASLVPEFEKKIQIWAAGVKDEGDLKNLQGQALIFQKNGSVELLEAVKRGLLEAGIQFQIIEYGKFKHKDYLKLLQTARFVVYLSQSESQGLALHESWMANIPTLVWNRGFMQYENYQWKDAKISAPYLNPLLGMFFSGADDFQEVAQRFVSQYNNFQPRLYSQQNFSNYSSAQKFIEIFKKV